MSATARAQLANSSSQHALFNAAGAVALSSQARRLLAAYQAARGRANIKASWPVDFWRAALAEQAAADLVQSRSLTQGCSIQRGHAPWPTGPLSDMLRTALKQGKRINETGL